MRGGKTVAQMLSDAAELVPFMWPYLASDLNEFKELRDRFPTTDPPHYIHQVRRHYDYRLVVTRVGQGFGAGVRAARQRVLSPRSVIIPIGLNNADVSE